MEQKRTISNQADLLDRISEIESKSDFYLDRMQDELTTVSTYIPVAGIKESLSIDSFIDVSSQLDKHGLSLGVLMPMFLNNTFFKNKDDATKALVTALSLVLDNSVDLSGLSKRLIGFFSSEDGEKHLNDTMLTLNPSKGIVPRIFE
jgi:hypothetical protein